MSVEKIRNALGLLQEDPDNESAWADIEEVVTGGGTADAVRELEMARVRHEQLKLWWVVARLLELEIALDEEPDIAAAKQLELGRIYHEELLREDDAIKAFRAGLGLRPDDRKAREALGDIEFGRANLEATVEHALVEALDSNDPTVQVPMLLRAAEAKLRYAGRNAGTLKEVGDYLTQALQADATHHRALAFATLYYAETREWEKLAEVLTQRATHAPARDERIDAAHQLCLVLRNKLEDEKRILEAHQMLLDLDPSNPLALAYLVELYSKNEQWDELAALYEDQLNAGAVKPSEELGVWVQLAMLNWKTRGQADQAETYFDKVRKADPKHAGMLEFFREYCRERGETGRLMGILTEAARALGDGKGKSKILSEIAGLAEGEENARRAIEQYKAILRSDPDNEEARDKLKALYLQTESYNALVELYRQDLTRLGKDEDQKRIEILREVAKIYGERMRSDTALLTVLTQILQIDENDIEAVRGLIRVYEALGRWRDLLNMQQKLAELTENQPEKVNLLRAVARRWLDQFSNVQNAISAYEALLEATRDDIEAREKLRDLYKKRRAWPKLYELYESQLDAMEGDQRIELMLEMARLASERLDKGDDAIRLLKEVLVFRPDAEGVLDQLERQAERQKDFQTMGFVLEKRIDAADDERTKVQLLQKLGALLSDKIEDHDAAKEAWRRVLELSPGHKRALRVLRQSYVQSRDWAGLETLYESQNDFEGLADFLSTTADRSEDPQERIELSFRAAAAYEGKLAAPERAARSYERVLSIDDKNERAARALLPLYEKEEKWSRLPGLYSILLGASDSLDEKITILHKVAEITGGPLANKAGALGYARRAYELSPDEQGLRRLREWSEQAGDWAPFIDVVRARLGSADDMDRASRRELKLMLAGVYASEVEKLDEAVEMYRSLLEEDPGDTETAQELERLLRAADRRDDLRWLFGLRAERFQGEARADAFEEWAIVEEEVFGEPEKAVELLRQVVEIEPTRITALSALTRLLLASDDYRGAAATLETQRDATDGEERLEIETRLAELYLDHLDSPVKAYDACVRALKIADNHPPVVAMLERLMEIPRTRARASESLERIYQSVGAPEKQAAALRAILETVEDRQRRLELCQRLADVHEHELGDAGSAFEVILNTLLEAPGELQLWDRAAALAQAGGRPTDLAEAYRNHLIAENDAMLGDDLRVELGQRAAVLHEEELGDAEGAIPYLERMLAIDPRNQPAFERLKSILHAVERWSDLERLYQSTFEVTEGDADKVELLHQAAVVCEEMLDDDARAISYYERILAIDPLHQPTVEALERLYAREERYGELADLLEKRLGTTTESETPDVLRQLIDLYLRRLERHDRVMGHLEELLRLRTPEDPAGEAEARELAEECLKVPALRQAAAALLDQVYEASDDARELVRVLDVRLESADSDDSRRDILRRVAHLRQERLDDDAGAFAALSQLMPLDPDDADVRDRLLDVGRRLGEHAKMADALLATAERCTTPATRGEILMEAAQLFRDRLDDTPRAERVYREVLAIDSDDGDLSVSAAKALAEIYEEEGRHADLAQALATQVRLSNDVDDKRELYARIANIHEDLLENDREAIAAWKARLGEDPADLTALRALERLYERTEEWRELVEVLRSLEQTAIEGDERKRCMVKASEVLAQELGETDEAILAWRGVLDDFGPERDTLSALAKLYDNAARWEELAEIYQTWLAVTDEADDQIELFAGLGDVRRQHLDDAQGALDAYREVLTMQPSHARGRAALESMLGHEDAEVKREAAEIIGPLYEADGDAERLLRVLDIEIESTFDAGGRLETLERALRTAEDTLGNPSQAFDYAARGVREALGDASLARWLETIERLAAETGRWRDLLDLYESVTDEILDAEIQQSTRLRGGDLARNRLEDRDRAIRHYQAALEAQANDKRAMVALEELYGETGNNQHLLEILQQRAESADDDSDRTALLVRAARLQAGPLADREGAIATYEQLLDLSLDAKAVAALEALYAEADRHDDLVRLYERQLDQSEGREAADVRVKIARLSHEKLGDAARALDELGEARRADPDHRPTIELLEGLLERMEDAENRAEVARMLEDVYLARHDWTRLKSTLEARLDTTPDPAERGELLTRLSTLYEEQLEDYSAALDTIAKRLKEDPTDENIWAEVERLGRVLGTDADLRVAQIFAGALEQVSADDPKSAELAARTGERFAAADRHEEALRWYRRAHEFTPDSRELFEAIDELLVKLERPEERIEHYKSGLDQTFEDAVRVEYLHVIAQLQREKMQSDDDAIQTLRDLLDIEESNAGALDALTQLYQHAGRVDDLAELYERRADLAPDPEHAAPYRLELARLLGQRESARDRAVDQLETIVTEIPWHEDAIAELEKLIEDSIQKLRVIDILRPLYQRSDNWRGLIRLNDERLALAEVPMDKVDVLMDTAALWEDQGRDPEKAFAVVRMAFALVPDHETTREALERLAGELGAWEELADSYRQAAHAVDDELVKRQLLSVLADVCDQRLDDPRSALQALGELSELDPGDPEPLERMDKLCMLLSDWTTLVTVLERKAENAPGDEERADLLRRLGSIRRDMLDDEDGALEAYERALDIMPESVRSLDRLIVLYEERDATRLVELLRQRIEFSAESDETRHGMILHAAEVYVERLENRQEAIHMLELARDARPTDAEVLGRLAKLYEAEEMWDALLDNLKTQAGIVEDAERRLELRNRIGDLYVGKHDNAFDALNDGYRLVLEEDTANEHALGAVRKIGENYEELRLEVAELIEPLLTSAGRYRDLVEVLELRFSAQSDPEERAKTLRGMALIREEQLDDAAGSRDTLLRALKETPEDASLHDDVLRLCDLTSDFTRYAEALEERADAVFDAEVQTDLMKRLGRIAEEQLDDPKRAIAAYRRASEQAAEPGPLLEALDRLYTAAGNHSELARVLERRIDLENDDKARAALHYRLGKLQVDAFHDKHAGLSALRLAADIDPEHAGTREELEKLTDVEELFEEAAEALDAMYRVSQDSAARARLHSKRINYAKTPGERVRQRLELAQMLEEEAFDTKSAQEVIEEAFSDDASDEEILAQLERLAQINSGAEGGDAWRRAAQAVSNAVRKALDAEKAGEGEGVMTPELAKELFLRTARWLREHVGEHQAAEEHLQLAIEQDPQSAEALLALEEIHRGAGRERDLIATLRKLAEIAQASSADIERSPSELRREAKVLAETQLGDNRLAEQILREMLEADEADVWALTELCGVVEKNEDHKELYTLLNRRIELMPTLYDASGPKGPEVGELRELRHKAARVAADKLDDLEAAIGLFEQAFEDDPRDSEAATALRELFGKLKRHEDMLRLIERLMDQSDSPTERADLRLESARICIEILEAPTEGIDHLHAVLEEVPGHAGAVGLLVKMLEREGRDDELADLLDKQIELAREKGERTQELGYRVKLSELYETKLNDSDRAITGYLGVIEADPAFKPALRALTRLYEQQGKSREAAETSEKLLGEVIATRQADEDDVVRLALKARDLFVAVGEKEAACRVIERALEADSQLLPNDGVTSLRDAARALYRERHAWDKLAELYEKEAEEATDAADKVLRYRQAAEIHSKERGDHAAAAGVMQKALDLKGDDRELMLALCDEYTKSGRGKEAIEVLNRVVESYGGRRSKELAEIHHRIASAHLSDGAREAALKELESARKMDPGSVGILHELGTLLLKLADDTGDDTKQKAYVKDAGNAFRALLLQRLDADAPVGKAEVFYLLAEVSKRENDKKKAIQMAERALSNDKEHNKAKALLAELKS